MRCSQTRLLLVLPYIALWQFGYFVDLNKYIVVLLALFPLMFMKRKDFRINRTSFLSVIFAILFVVLLIEPGIAYGKIEFDVSYGIFFQTLPYSLILVVSVLSVIHGIVIKGLWKKPFAGMAISALIYILTITPFSLFFDTSNLVKLFLFDELFIVVLSFYLGFLYLKSNLNLVPGMIFLSIYTVFASMGISILVSNLFNLVWEVIAISVTLFLTEKTVKEPIAIKRVFKSKRKVRKRKSGWAFIVSALIVLLVLLVILPAVTHESHYIIADPTDSMYPVIHPGSLLFITHISASNVKVGTIIVFNAPWQSGTLYAHEVIGINYSNGIEYFITKGVNNPAKDPLPVPANDLVGRVAYSLPYLGYLLIYYKISVAVIIICAVVFYAFDLRK